MRHIFVVGRRWFDKVNGNTYFSVKCYVDGKLIGYQPYEYGYGDQYMQRAAEFLHDAGIYPTPDYFKYPWQLARDAGDTFTYTVADMSRKKDLAQ